MNQSEFRSFWKSKFPESYPIGHELKSIYAKRWFRIHSLPNSKRYADSEEEYLIILKRQNQIITDIIGEGEGLILLFGLYSGDSVNENYKEINEFGEFEKVDTLELHKLRPEENGDESYFDIFIKKSRWKPNGQNEILRAIADDKIRMMLISLTRNRI